MIGDYDDDIDGDEVDNPEAMADIDEDDAFEEEDVRVDRSTPRSSLAVRRALELRREQKLMARELDYLEYDLDD